MHNDEIYSKVKFFRLITGDDLITEVKDTTESVLTVVNPMKVLIDADLDAGRQTIYMHCWMPQGIAKGNECKLFYKDIIFVADVEQDIVDYYAGVVFEMHEDSIPFKKEGKTEYMDDGKKIISFESMYKGNKDKPN
jgi:hypothetical protein